MKKMFLFLALALIFLSTSFASAADDSQMQNILRRLDNLEKENKQLKQKVEILTNQLTEREDVFVESVKEDIKSDIQSTVSTSTAASLHKNEKEGWFTKAQVSWLKPGGLDNIDFAVMGNNDDDESSAADETVFCQLDDYNQCFEWINLRESLVDSLSSTCVDDGGVVVDSCPTENRIGTCEESGGPSPDLLNHFYLPSGQDPDDYAALKEEACTDAGGVWTPV